MHYSSKLTLSSHPKWPPAAILSINLKQKKLRIDLKWPEMRKKLFADIQNGRRRPFCQIKKKKLARYAIESEFRTSKITDQSEMASNAIQRDFQTSKNGRRQPFCQKLPKKFKLRIDLKWPENAIESEFRTSKMADVCHFVQNLKKMKLHIDLKWPEMRLKVKFGHPSWPTLAILSKIPPPQKVAY